MTTEQTEEAPIRAPDPELTSSQRKHLRGLGHSLKPVVVVGKAGLTESVQAEVNRTLDDHELIKVKLQGCDRDERKVLSAQLVESLNAQLAGLVGNVALLYRRNRDPERRNISPDPGS